MGQIRGLAQAKEISHNRSKIAWELKNRGKTVIGYLCCYPPPEIITAAGAVPYRIIGNMNEPITQADTYVDYFTCPFVRSYFDLAFKGHFDFLDGVVVPHSCDHIERTYPIWRFYLKLPYYHFINVPHVLSSEAYTFFKAELDTFKRSLEEFIGRKISHQDIAEAIKRHNENRDLMRKLYETRKQNPPLISGSEMIEVLLAVMSIPAAEGNDLLKSVVKEVSQRRKAAGGVRPRLLLYGGPIDNAAFVELIEECGAVVVIDDICIGTRVFRKDVELTEDPLQGLSIHYLKDIHCPRTFREEKAKERFSYLINYARDFGADAAITYSLRYCDTYGFDLPDVEDAFKEAGLTVLHLLEDYDMTSTARLKTRITAFVETIR